MRSNKQIAINNKQRLISLSVFEQASASANIGRLLFIAYCSGSRRAA